MTNIMNAENHHISEHTSGRENNREKRSFLHQVEKKRKRKQKHREAGEHKVWFGLGMFGLVGWSVAIPTLIGIAVGVWIDSTYPSGYSWTLMLLFIGVVVGCWNAWYWIHRESRVDHER